MLTLITYLSEIVFVRNLHCKSILSVLFPLSTFWTKVTIHSEHMRVGNYALPPLRWIIYISYLQFCIYLVIFHLFVYGTIYMSYGLMDIYFRLWVVLQHFSVYFVALIVLVLVLGGFLNWLLFPFGILSFLWFLGTYLLSSTARCSKFILYTPCRSNGRQPFLQGALVTLY